MDPSRGRPMSSADATFLRRAIALAKTGRGITEPNPSVGCLLVRADQLLGAGRTHPPGGPHAEPTAIADAAAQGHDPRGTTAYVTLEPCCHTDKRTPPCVPAMIRAGVARVVVGCLDPNPAVNGRGLAQLRAAGINVTEATGPLANECSQLIAPFEALTVHRRPYVTLKFAQSADGFIAHADGSPATISSTATNEITHRLRARMDAILIGGQTLRTDNPVLTARPAHPKDPTRPLFRAVLSPSEKLPPTSRLFQTPANGPTLIYTSIPQALQDLADKSVSHLLVESGRHLAQTFLALNLIDRLWQITSPTHLLCGIPALTPPHDWVTTQTLFASSINPDSITEYLNPKSPLTHHRGPSIDAEQLLGTQNVPRHLS